MFVCRVQGHTQLNGDISDLYHRLEICPIPPQAFNDVRGDCDHTRQAVDVLLESSSSSYAEIWQELLDTNTLNPSEHWAVKGGMDDRVIPLRVF